ncbi:MAG: primosomal protein N', partial [Alphaproteobacteria bacterium]|nr:primosomal protein N' [Alphaproteobacteria bacterium]
MPASAHAITVPVLLPLPLPGSYDYLGEGMAPGDIVEVPLGRRLVAGVVWDGEPGGVEAGRLKPVARRFEVPPMRPALRRFVARVANYTLSPPGSVLRMALSVPAALDPPKPRRAWRLADIPPADMRATPQRRLMLDLLQDGGALTAAEISRETGVGPAVLKGLAALGAVEPVALPPCPSFLPPDPDGRRVALTDEQAAAAAGLGGTGFSVSLLEGVAGAGKTEVYFEAVAAALRQGRQALILLPEIALTAQWMQRFEARFGARPLAWHS